MGQKRTFRRGRGNRVQQYIRRKHRKIASKDTNKVVVKEEPKLLIDGNYSRYVVGYCTKYRGYLSFGLYERHACEGWNRCKCFRPSYSSDKPSLEPEST